MTRNGFAPILVLLLAAGVLAVGAYLYSQQRTSQLPSGPGEVFCTQEAKQCPDGSYVGRTGPNCEFAECPSFVPERAIQQSSTTSATPTAALPWLIYQNTKYGYEIKYPQGAQYSIFAISQEDPRGVIFDLESFLGVQRTPGEGGINYEAMPKLFAQITSSAKNALTLEEWVNQETAPGHGSPIDLFSKKSFVVGGEPAYWTEFSGGGLGTGQYNMVLIFFMHGNVRYRIAGARVPGNLSPARVEQLAREGSMSYVQNYEPVFDQMVASFKFIEE